MDINGSVLSHIMEISDDDVVISGMSGRFPNSISVAELYENLRNKVDMCDESEVRFKHRPDLPKRSGKIHGLDLFDAGAFGMSSKIVDLTDPTARCLLEHSYECILDAGINPMELRGTNTGVYVGKMYMESADHQFKNNDLEMTDQYLGYQLIGSSRGVVPNRISYSLDLNGPSFYVDSACSSSMIALNLAYNAIKNGECDAAIVGSDNTTLMPDVSLGFAKLGVLSPDGFCRPFDQKASGFARGEAVCTILLQKRKYSKRVYATLVHSKVNNDGYKKEGLTYPAGNMQKCLMESLYKEINMDPSYLDYMEAHGTATTVGDPEECKGIYEVFCKNRTKPLLIGSLKSNMGHTEAASAICSLVKVVLGFETGQILPNINFNKVKQEIIPLVNGALKVVDELTALPGPLAAISSFGLGGTNGHTLLKRHEKFKINQGIPSDNIPRLVCWSGRTEQACHTVFDEICKRPLDAEFIALLQNTQTISNPVNMYKGYGIFKQDGTNNAKCITREVIENNEPSNRPFVWVFSGMGSQWVSMGTSLMCLPIFRSAIEKCHAVLKTKNINLIEILTSEDETMFDNILHSFVGIAAVQIGLVDVLRSLNLEPDYIIGHSVGELGCAYADGCMTAEEMILSSYSRGVASLETKVIYGSMAAIGLGYQQIRSILPEGIEVACHNGPDSCTISGPADSVTKFVKELTTKGVFAKEVACSNIPYHSSHIAKMGPNLLQKLRELNKISKRRSAKWLSTSVPEKEWDNESAQLSSAEYHTNNLLNPVLFEETIKHLPENAVTLEIAPHGLLQAILKRSMLNATHISLTQRANSDSLKVLLAGLGKLHNQKINVPVSKLYSTVKFPVSAGTPFISPLIEWDHSETYYLTKFESLQLQKAEHTFQIDISKKDYEYIAGHTIDGRILFPATGYLYLAWSAFALMHEQSLNPADVPVEISDVKFLRATTLRKGGTTTQLKLVIHPVNGQFEISEGDAIVVSGCIRPLEDKKDTILPINDKPSVVLHTNDFYMALKLRGYLYDGEFKSVLEARSDGLGGKIKWNKNFIGFMDCMLQLAIIGIDTGSLMVPTGIKRIRIDPKKFLNSGISSEDDLEYVNVVFSRELKLLQVPGIEIFNLTTNVITRRKSPVEPLLESYQFIPYHVSRNMDVKDAIRVLVQLSLENVPVMNMKVLELNANIQQGPLTLHVQDALEDLPKITADYFLITDKKCSLSNVSVQTELNFKETKDLSLLIAANFCTSQQLMKFVKENCQGSAFIVSREALDFDHSNAILSSDLSIISTIPVNEELLVLIYYKTNKEKTSAAVVKITSTDKSFNWLETLQSALKSNKTFVVSQNESSSGVIGLVNCLRREPKTDAICVFIDDPNAPEFNQEVPFYKNQLQKGLIINVYRQGQWGHYRHLLLNSCQKLMTQTQHCYANVLRKGDLSSLTWFQGFLDSSAPDVVKIQYSSLNFRDVMVATGKIDLSAMLSRFEAHCMLGFEFSGVMKNGRRVMGMGISACMATYTQSNPYSIWDVPESWTLEEAATVPAVYATVYASFFIVTKIKKGQSILIHAGTGGVGLAAIRVVLAYGLEVFTTVSTNEKKEYLLSSYPKLNPLHIGNSRDTSFYNMIMLHTNGVGVDYVLNSLADDKLSASLDCLARNGNFIEIGKYDILNDSKLGMRVFENSISFHAVMMDQALTDQKQNMMKKVHALIHNDLLKGIIKPLKTTVFKANEIEDAFRYLATAKHMGKILLQIHENEEVKQSLPINVLPRIYFKPNLVYIIPGGLGGFGLELADWMILRGCKKLVLSSSRGISKEYQAYRIKLWKTYGVQIIVSTDDITTREGCLKLINNSQSLGSIGGIFNLAVLLRDGIFENQNVQKFVECVAVKAFATEYLDELSRKLCPSLEHFVVFSSVSCGRGNAGQTNYGMANSIMERIIEKRVADGLPGKAVQWGAVGEVGLVAEMAQNKIDMEIGGTLLQRISSCLETLDTLLSCSESILSSMVVAEKKIVAGTSALDTICNIIGIKDMKSLTMDQKLADFGMDSLMAVEVKEVLEQNFEINLSPQELKNLTFQTLIDLTKKNGDKESSDSSNLFNIALLLENVGYEAHSAKTVVSLNKITEPKTSVVIIPGMEGVVNKTWSDLGEKLMNPAYLVQLLHSRDFTNLRAVTDIHFKDIMNNIVKNSNTFCIVGYSFGSLIALNLVHQLEKIGLTGKFIIIEGSPIYLNKSIKDATENPKSKQSDNFNFVDFLRGFMKNITLENFTNPNFLYEIVDKIYELDGKTITWSKDYCKAISQGVANRTKIMANLVPDDFSKIKSDIFLIKCDQQLIDDIEDDYGLKAYTSGKITVKTLKGNHSTVLNQTELVTMLNEMST